MKYLIFFLCLFLLPAAAFAEGKKAYGLHEKVILPDVSPAPLEAKLDTGADTCSLGADDIRIFEKEGEDRVRFTPQVKGAPEMELPLSRHSRIKQRSGDTGDSTSIRRPVVMLNICFDGNAYEIEVNLTDRSRFSYPLLIGAGALVEFGAVVDPSLEGQAAASCP